MSSIDRSKDTPKTSRISCQLSLYPDYLHNHMGLDFSERFHTDPIYRNERWKEISRWVRDRFGRWGCGSSDPPDSYSVTTLDPVHLASWLFGSRLTFAPDRFPDAHDYPQAGISDLGQFNRRPKEADLKIRQLMDQTKRLVDRFGPEKVSVPYYAPEDGGMRDMEATHCPLTISYRLFGERLLLEMFDNPDGVRYVFREVLDLSKELAAEFRENRGIPDPSSACVGACAATFLGPAQFREFLRPSVLEYAAGRPLYFHSCGLVNSLLGTFAELSAASDIRVFDCREQAQIDISRAAAAFPDATISYMFSPSACLTRTPELMRRAVQDAVRSAGGRSMHLILNLPAGAADELVDAFFDVCLELGADLPKEAGFGFV